MHESFICLPLQFWVHVFAVLLSYSTCSSSVLPSAPGKDYHFVAPSVKNSLFSGENKKPDPSWMSLLDEIVTFQIAKPINGVVEQGLTL